MALPQSGRTQPQPLNIFDQKTYLKSTQSATMDHQPEPYFRFTNGESRWSQSLDVATQVIYHPDRSPLCSNDVCIGPTTNNQVEYDAVIRIMCDTLHQGICHMHVYLDSQVVVLQLNQKFETRDTHLFRKYLRAKRLSRKFHYITFTHVPRSQNQIVEQQTGMHLE